jgi:hypothetical protein
MLNYFNRHYSTSLFILLILHHPPCEFFLRDFLLLCIAVMLFDSPSMHTKLQIKHSLML